MKKKKCTRRTEKDLEDHDGGPVVQQTLALDQGAQLLAHALDDDIQKVHSECGIMTMMMTMMATTVMLLIYTSKWAVLYIMTNGT